MPLVPIESIDDPRVADYSQVRDAELRRDRYDAPGGLFVAEGELVVRRLVASRYRVRSVLATHARLRTLTDVTERLPDQTPVYVVDQATMNGVVGFNIHRGVLAIGERGPAAKVEELAAAARCAVVLEDLTNHDNIGGVFRNVAGLGAGSAGQTCVVLSPRCADPLYRKSIRVSMGAVLLVPYARLEEWPGDLGRLKDAGYELLGMTPSERAVDIGAVSGETRNKSEKKAIILGAEGPGLSDDVLRITDRHIRIDMPGRWCAASESNLERGEDEVLGLKEGIDSLNVSVACAIALHRLFPGEHQI